MKKLPWFYKVFGRDKAFALFQAGTSCAYAVAKQTFVNFVLLRVSHNVFNGLEPNVKGIIYAFFAHYSITEKDWTFDAAYKMYQRQRKTLLSVPISIKTSADKIDKEQAKAIRKALKEKENAKKNVSTPLNAPKKRRRGRKKAENSLQIRFI